MVETQAKEDAAAYAAVATSNTPLIVGLTVGIGGILNVFEFDLN
jgi:hypothetical protein